jgi:hypothetical protein
MAKNGSLALDANGDLLRQAGRFVRVTDAAYIVQKVRSRLLFFLGEWFLDVEGVGFPYWQQVLGVKAANLPAIRAAYRDELLGTQGVASVEQLDVTLSAQRRLSVSFRAVSDAGALLSDSFEVVTP